MEQKKEDRRIRITKLAIRESLIELMQRLPISKISVKLICEAADINRSTFYAHYADQYDLLDKIQREVLAGINEYLSSTRFMDDSEDAVSVIAQILAFARPNAPLLRVLLSEHGDSTFQSELMYLAQQKTIAELRGNTRLPPDIIGYLERFSITGVLAIIRGWLANDCADEPVFLATLIIKLVRQGIDGLRED